jgi:hypothetical protein
MGFRFAQYSLQLLLFQSIGIEALGLTVYEQRDTHPSHLLRWITSGSAIDIVHNLVCHITSQSFSLGEFCGFL